jgi:dGTPase
MRSAASAGRVHPEATHSYRSPYQRDRDRIIHSGAFRRLAHKTQVFTGDMGDYHRSRLTHTLEVASIARTAARTLRLNEDLVEALALLHDIGHPPFGHAGEDALNACLAEHGGFNHNRQALRIVELLETRYPEFPGLNLTQEVLSGQQTRTAESRRDRTSWRLLEVQIVDAADSIAYDTHDADDAVELKLLTLADLDESALWRTAARRARRRYVALDDEQFRRAAVHELIDMLVGDLLAASKERLAQTPLAGPEDAIAFGKPLIAPSEEMAPQKIELERLLYQRVYRHPTLLRQRRLAAELLAGMFAHYARDPRQLPASYAAIIECDGVPRAVADFLSGMTDRFAMEAGGTDRSPNAGELL